MGLFELFKRKKVELSEEQKKWNKMWENWIEGQVDSPYSELMTYQSEVNNGGHDQFFTNVANTDNLEKTLYALENILSSKLKCNLQKAYKAYLALEENEDIEEAEKTMQQCDDAFYENEDEINFVLKEYASKIEI